MPALLLPVDLVCAFEHALSFLSSRFARARAGAQWTISVSSCCHHFDIQPPRPAGPPPEGPNITRVAAAYLCHNSHAQRARCDGTDFRDYCGYCVLRSY